MTKTKKRSVWAWVGAIAAGCGLCCVPLIVPLVGGTALAGGLSLAVFEGLPLDWILCGVALAGIAGAVVWLVLRRKRQRAEACHIAPLEDPRRPE